MKIILIDAWNTFVTEDGVFKEVQILLDSYKSKKIILTNANDGQMIKFGIVNMPYEVFTLKHNPDKIDPKYYETMLGHFGLSANDVVYFEHNADAVKSAQSIGITTYHYDKDKKDLVGLKEFLDKNLVE